MKAAHYQYPIVNQSATPACGSSLNKTTRARGARPSNASRLQNGGRSSRDACRRATQGSQSSPRQRFAPAKWRAELLRRLPPYNAGLAKLAPPAPRVCKMEGGAPATPAVLKRPPHRIRAANSGSALIVTLGLLTIITLAVVAFVVTQRIEHLAARNTLNRTMARQYVDVGLAEAMYYVNVGLSYNQSCYPVTGWPTNIINDIIVVQDCFGLICTNAKPIPLFRGTATNLLPGTLATQASQIEYGGKYIIETNAVSGPTGVQAGRVSFLVANLSGMLDVHALNTNRQAALGEGQSAFHLINPTGGYQRVYFSQPDLTAANGGAVSNLVTFAYDPGPDVFFEANNRNAMFGTSTFLANLPSRSNINVVANLSNITCVSQLLLDAGVTNEPDHVAWNIFNYLTSGQIPKIDADKPYRTDYGVKDLPLINEIVLEQIPGPLPNHYGVSVELWYPFVPNSAPNCHLWVGVYTNEAAVAAEFANFNNNHDAPPSPIGFEVVPPQMNYDGGSNEFFVGSTINAGVNPVVFAKVIVDNIGPPLITHTNYLPISADNPVWIWPRVYVDNTCVDEALVDATLGVVCTWTNTGSIQFADPRANNTLAHAILTNAPSLGTTNANCSICSLPLVHTDAPMQSAGEIRHIYAPGMGLASDLLNLSSPVGAACRDRFTVRATNAPVHGLVQANSPYTNVWRAVVSDIAIGWTNAVGNGTLQILAADQTGPDAVGSVIPTANLNTSGHGWLRFQEMLPDIASNIQALVGGQAMTNNTAASAELGDILAGISDRVTFRGNTFLVLVCGQRLSPLGLVLADQRAAFTIVRDAYTSRWVVDHAVWLTE